MGKEEKKYSILDELGASSGYDIALMTTFNFEIGFFERAVLNRLFLKDVKTVSLFVDSNEFTKALNEFDIMQDGSHIGKKYMVTPVKINGSFHPKVILLLGEKKARLFIGSANIKTSGYTLNNEVFNIIDYDTNNTEYLDVIVAAIDFFDAVNAISYKLDTSVINKAKEYIYYHKNKKNGEVFFLHNMKQSILEQVSSIVKEEIKSVKIAVPYYDKELLALQQIKDLFPDAKINLYIQNKNSTFPINYNNKNRIVKNIRSFSRFKDNSSSSSGNFYHGKVFLLKTSSRSIVFYGSTNCTLSALTKTYLNGGNVECDILEIGDVKEFDYFFENMKLDKDEGFTSHEMIYDTPIQKDFIFLYGKINEKIELHLGCNKEIDNYVIKYGDYELDYIKLKEEIIVYIKEELFGFLTDVFEIAIEYNEKIEVLRCWAFNPIVLANNREKLNKYDNLDGFDINSTGNRFIEDRKKLLRAEVTCFNEIQEYKKNQKYINQIKIENELEDDDFEDFVVDYQIPDEYRYAYRQFTTTSKIRGMFVKRFLVASISVGTNEHSKIEKEATTSNDNRVESRPRKATSEEKLFERFVKNKVKGMLNDIYVDVIETEHYIGLFQVIVEIFDKYCNEENVEDIFKQDYVVETKSLFMQKIISKSLDNISNKDDLENAIIKHSFQVIFDTYYYYRNLVDQDDKWHFESLNKTLLHALEEKYKLRQTYVQFIKEISVNHNNIYSVDFEKMCKYIEHLYGYKTFEMLCDTIFKCYEGAEITKKGSFMIIKVSTKNINECRKIDTSLLKEILNYSKNVENISTVKIDFININESSGSREIAKICHSVRIDYHQWSYTEYLKNGNRFDSKSQFLSF